MNIDAKGNSVTVTNLSSCESVKVVRQMEDGSEYRIVVDTTDVSIKLVDKNGNVLGFQVYSHEHMCPRD